MIFKAVGNGRPYPAHGLETARDWANVPPRMVRLDELITTKGNLDLAALVSEDSTFYGDLLPTWCSGRACSISRTACTGPCGPRFNNDLLCTHVCWCLTSGTVMIGW